MASRTMQHALITIVLVLSVGIVRGQGGEFVTVREDRLFRPDGTPLFLKGVNLGNWLVPEGYMFKFRTTSSPRLIAEAFRELLGPDASAEFWNRYRSRYITRGDIRQIKRLGFNSIRVPFNFRLLTPEDRPAEWLEEGFALLDSVVRWSKAEGLLVVLDMHCAPGGQTGDNIDDSYGYPWLFESDAARQRTAGIWREIARRYAREPAVLGYDLLNEPIPQYFDTTRLNPRLEPLYRAVTSAIREVDTVHFVILGGARWDTNFGVFGPPFDRRAMYTFHRYWTDTLRAGLVEYLDFRAKHRVPLWMGESGENTDAWVGSFRRLLETEKIGWCFWPWKKMDAKSCPMTFPKPGEWDEIVKYVEGPRATFEDLRAHAVDRDRARKILWEFLESCSIEHCVFNEGYVTALGLTVPEE
jgi:endoglucanase